MRVALISLGLTFLAEQVSAGIECHVAESRFVDLVKGSPELDLPFTIEEMLNAPEARWIVAHTLMESSAEAIKNGAPTRRELELFVHAVALVDCWLPEDQDAGFAYVVEAYRQNISVDERVKLRAIAGEQL